MNFPLSDDSATNMDEMRFVKIAEKRIAEIEALWRVNAESETVLFLHKWNRSTTLPSSHS
jgi:hypothetical protein